MFSNMSSNSSEAIETYGTEGAVVITCGFICTIGNLSCMILIVFHKRFRKTTVVILCHHCFLDFIKSIYCFPFGYSLITSRPAPFCNFLGSTYVFAVTTSAYNMVALVVNQYYDVIFTEYRTDDCNCVVFGVFIIWFISFLLNLGISIIPSNTQYNPEIGSCLFIYGRNYSYILHVLWILLVSIAVTMSLMFFFRMRKNLIFSVRYHKWKSVHESFSEEFEKMLDFNIQDEDQIKSMISHKSALQSQLRTTKLLMSIVISFIIFWYPLFLLTICDYSFQVESLFYRILTIIAWCHPITTPVFCSLILRDIRFKTYTLRDISSNLMPLQRMSFRRYHYKNTNTFDFECESHLDKELDEHDIEQNIDHHVEEGISFANQTFKDDFQRKVVSTV